MQDLFVDRFQCDVNHKGDEVIQSRVSLGAGTRIQSATFKGCSYFGRDCDVRDSSVGRFSAFGNFCRLVRTEIGGFCSVGDNVLFNAGTHPTNWLSTHLFQMHPTAWAWSKDGGRLTPLSTDFVWRGTCKVGHDVWIGANTTLQTGVVVGNGVIIAEGSFVSQDVPDFAIVAGKPAQVKKYRFSPETILRLQRIKWWDRALDQLVDLPYDDIDASLNKLESL